MWGSRGYGGGLGCGERRIIDELSEILTGNRMSGPLGRVGTFSFGSQRKRESFLAQAYSQAAEGGRIPRKEHMTLTMWEE